MQMLVWALEEIEKLGNEKAEHYARLALAHLEEGRASASASDYHQIIVKAVRT